MTTLQNEIDRLTRKKRGKGGLGPSPPREKIAEQTALFYNDQGSSSGNGLAWPLTEINSTPPTAYYQMVSSDGFVVFEFGRETHYEDDNGDQGYVVNLDPSA